MKSKITLTVSVKVDAAKCLAVLLTALILML